MSATRTADPVFSLMTAQDLAEAVGSHQRLARAGKGWSVSEVAGKADVSVPSIEAPESGDGRLRDFVAVSMAMGFGHELWSVTRPFAASTDEQERIEHARMVGRLGDCAYLPTLAALQASGHANQHSLLSWLTFMCANATMALWLYEQNGRRMNSAIAFNAFNALTCGAVAASISWLRLTQLTSGFPNFF